MEYMGIRFNAIMATPAVGKTHLCARDNRFVDADEIKMRYCYKTPWWISRDQIERTKTTRQLNPCPHIGDCLERELDRQIARGKILIAQPCPFFYEYFAKRQIPFCLVYNGADMREEIINRLRARKSPQILINTYTDMALFTAYYYENLRDSRPVVKYEFGRGEYLDQIVLKFQV